MSPPRSRRPPPPSNRRFPSARARALKCPHLPPPLLDFLQRLQEAALAAFSFDPKLYIDLSLRSDLDAVERAFAGLPRSPDIGPRRGPGGFIAAHLGAAGSPSGVRAAGGLRARAGGFLPRVRSPAVRAWALEVHALWRNLSRRVDDAVREVFGTP
ncbi:hypothetical protein NL676_009956 [Syzygium grande]|nr:hypothetical protein NL676_009956 [Syzygium grande]